MKSYWRLGLQQIYWRYKNHWASSALPSIPRTCSYLCMGLLSHDVLLSFDKLNRCNICSYQAFIEFPTNRRKRWYHSCSDGKLWPLTTYAFRLVRRAIRESVFSNINKLKVASSEWNSIITVTLVRDQRKLQVFHLTANNKHRWKSRGSMHIRDSTSSSSWIT